MVKAEVAWFKEICWATVVSISSVIRAFVSESPSPAKESRVFFKHPTPFTSFFDSEDKASENPFAKGILIVEVKFPL